MSFKKVLNDIFSVDNLIHTVIAIAVVTLSTLFLPIPNFISVIVVFIGFYVRELIQWKNKSGSWDFTLNKSFHKNMEWAVPTVAAMLTLGFLLFLMGLPGSHYIF